MRKALMIIIATLSLSSHAVADSAQRDTVEALLIATAADSALDAIYNQFDSLFVDLSEDLDVNDPKYIRYNQRMEKLKVLLREEVNWDTLKEPMIDLYMAHYTEQELQDMLAFYQSETGQSVVKKMPEVMAASMQITQQLMKDVYPKLFEMTKESEESLHKQHSVN